ncbi:MAG TPA: energy transducer TonB [Steroidobacteraceae bacterium]|nr:energy transducer TonB [Steroidobacteraceae bacterium]
MAVQILNDMPDAEVHRGEPLRARPRELPAPLQDFPASRAQPAHFPGRAVIVAITIALHVAGALAFMRMEYTKSVVEQATPIEASLIEDQAPRDVPPPAYAPPPMNIEYSLPTPDPIVIDTEIVASNAITTTPMSDAAPSTATPPVVESVEYLHAEPPVYPKESARRHEYGTVLLRILVDAAGRPAQIRVERSSGYERLDEAARKAAEKFLFRPHEVNGIRKAAQVLIPIGFDPPRKS